METKYSYGQLDAVHKIHFNDIKCFHINSKTLELYNKIYKKNLLRNWGDFIYMYECLPEYVSMQHVCAMPTEARRGR